MSYVKFAAVVAAGILVALGLYLLFGRPAEDKKKQAGEALVTLTPAQMRHFEYRIESIGTAEANEAVTIAAQVTERVAKVLFTEGQQVKKGELLVQLEDQEMSGGLAEMEVELARQQLEFERVKTLREKNVNSQKELDQQSFTLSAAKARVLVMQSKVRDRKIVAPFDGVVGIRQVSPGALVSLGEKITTLDDLSIMKLKFSVPELFLPDIKTGQTVRAVASAYPGRTFTGTVSIIDTRVDEVTRAVAVQAIFDNKDCLLKPGMLMSVELISRPRETLSVPEKCLLAYAKKQFVYVVDATRTAQRREITIGQRDYGVVEVLTGLKEGERIVLDGIALVKPGDKVRIAEAAAPAAKPETQGAMVQKSDGLKKDDPKGDAAGAGKGEK